MAIPSGVGDLLEARWYCALQNQVSINVRHFLVTAITGDGGLSDAVQAMDAVFAPLYKDLLSAAATYRGMTLQRIVVNPSAVVSSVGNTGVGLGGGAILAKQVAGIITFRTAFSGRKEHGRLYTAFMSQNDEQGDGTPTGGYLTFLDNLAQQMIDNGPYVFGLNGITVTPVLFSRTDGGVRQITTAVAQNKWATQRRRGDFGRTNVLPI